MTALLKYFASLCFFAATFTMFDANLAAHSALPWVFFLIGNMVWVKDSWDSNNMPWVTIGTVFIVLDLLLICDRLYHLHLVDYIQPILTIIDRVA